MNETDLMYASEDDRKFFDECTLWLPTHAGDNNDGLDETGTPIPYSCGAHSIKAFRQILDYVKPKTLLEIGFNIGNSSSLWLNLKKDLILVSCDISKKKSTLLAKEMLMDVYFDRFIYVDRNAHSFSLFTGVRKFDLIFIDGGHLLNDVVEDIKLALELKIPYIAFDDFLPQYGQVQEAIEVFGRKLEQVFVNGNIALYKNTTV